MRLGDGKGDSRLYLTDDGTLAAVAFIGLPPPGGAKADLMVVSRRRSRVAGWADPCWPGNWSVSPPSAPRCVRMPNGRPSWVSDPRTPPESAS